MQFFSTLMNQLRDLFQAQPATRKMTMVVILVASMGAMAWLMVRASTGGFMPVLSGADPSEVGLAMAKLNQVGIPARSDAGGTSLMVARNEQDRAVMILAMEGIFDNNSVGTELLDKNSFGESKFKQEKNYLRMREGDLARSLRTLREIESARVHLAMPEDSPFVGNQEQPKASVVLKLRMGTRLDEQKVQGIIHLISSSIEGMPPENVSIIDDNGNLLNRKDSPMAGLSGDHTEFKTQSELRLKNEVEKMLERTVGKGRVIASVQMDYDFSTLTQEETIYNPDDQEPILQMEKTFVEQRPGSVVERTVGSGSDGNLPDGMVSDSAAAGSAVAIGGDDRNDSTKEYLVSKRVAATTLNAPVLRRVTVGVMVDGKYETLKNADGTEKSEFQIRSPEEMKELERVVKAAIGFDDELRQDVVELSCVPFEIDRDGGAEASWFGDDMRRLVELGIQWGVIGLIGLLLILLVLKPVARQITLSVVTRSAEALPAGAAPRGLPGGEGQRSEANDMGKYGLSNILTPAEMIEDARLQEIQQTKSVADEKSQRVFQELQSEARNHPERTVSLIRQWMEEG